MEILSLNIDDLFELLEPDRTLSQESNSNSRIGDTVSVGVSDTPTPIPSLGVPITGQSIAHKDRAYLIMDLESFLLHLRNHDPSYTDRMQLPQWVLHYKFN